MNPQGTDLLSQLRDIHSAPAAPWWPPAPGWWVLAMILAMVMFLIARHFMQRYRAHQRRLQLIRFVERVESRVDPVKQPQEFLSSLNRVFKIVALRAFPESHCAFMQGREWTDFVQIKLDDSDSADVLAVLADGPYQPAPAFDAPSLSKIARKWIMLYG
ncbi:MAG: hypothetical protein ACI9H8_002105 [Lysobacterales bacterium]|jgi:hypothetical protein